MTHCTLFPTAIGDCAIAWRDERVVGTRLPDAGRSATRLRLAARTGAKDGPPPPAILRAIAAMTALLQGERIDLAFVACDFSAVDAFEREVYAAARAIPPGETRSYGELAHQLGDRRLARRVGTALGRNPFPIIVPCHRVIGADGRLVGFSADGGIDTKRRMLAIEGARTGAAAQLFDHLPRGTSGNGA